MRYFDKCSALFNRLTAYARQTAAAFVVGLGVGSFLVGPAALALVIPQNFAPRAFQTQQVHYLRFVVNFNDCVLVAGTCSVKRGAVPYNAFIIRATQQIITNFNSGTTDTLALATASGGAQLVAAQTVHAGAGGGTALTVVAANLGIAATGNGIAQTGGDGGFDIWSVYAQTGAAPTAGQLVIVIEYIGPNDGSCILVPMGSTAGAC
jgi:hypothetical protein